MSKETRATLQLRTLGVAFSLHIYDYDGEAERIGMQAAEAGLHPGDKRLGGGEIGQVIVRQRQVAIALQRSDDAFQSIPDRIDGGHPCALRRQQGGERRPDIAGGSGYDDRLAGEHVASPMVRDSW